MSNVIISVTDNYTLLRNHGNKQYIYFFLTERETEYAKKTECARKHGYTGRKSNLS